MRLARDPKITKKKKGDEVSWRHAAV